MHIMVIGATGQLGRELVASARTRDALEVSVVSRREPDPARQLDLGDAESIDRVLASVRPSHVILAAAATNVTWCEHNAAEAYRLNVTGTAAVAGAAARHDAHLTFFSTDYVFDGTDGPYAEDAPTRPINVYGAHKLEAEERILAAAPSNLIVRTCQVFGNDERRMNYVLRVADGLARGEIAKAPGDLYGTPTYAADLARVTFELIAAGAAGVWHVAGPDFVSRAELARMTARAFGRDPSAVEETRADDSDGVTRPRRSGLRSARLAGSGIAPLTPLADALGEMASTDVAAAQPAGARA